jgi:transcriptional regulator with XRE-family HTH domain
MNQVENEKIESKITKQKGKHQKAYYINYNIIKWGRKQADLTLKEAAQALDVSDKLLQQIENGKVALTLNDLRKIAKVYNINKNAFWLEHPPEKSTESLQIDTYNFAIYPESNEVDLEEYDEVYKNHLKTKVHIPVDVFEQFIEFFDKWRYCACGDEITTKGADKCDTCLFMDRIHSKREPPKGEIILNKIRTFLHKIYFSICLWLYEHSKAIRDIGWLDNETDFVKRTKKGKKN